LCQIRRIGLASDATLKEGLQRRSVLAKQPFDQGGLGLNPSHGDLLNYRSSYAAAWRDRWIASTEL
jgi:hypothetical protein